MQHPRARIWASLLILATHAGAAAQPVPPSFLFIMADDHAAHALSCYSGRINRTPNLDRLAAEGMRFTHAFCTNAICTPARAAVLTGRYSHANGVRTNSDALPPETHTVAHALRSAGYQTAIIGKWHLHRDPTGFDHWDILPGQGEYHDPVFITNGVRERASGYVTDITIDKAIDWIGRRDPARPFILFCHLKAPHRPWEPDERHAGLYEGADIPLPETWDDDHATRTRAATLQTMTIARHLTSTDLKSPPPEGLAGDDLTRWRYQRYIKDYLRCVASIDDNVGRLVAYVDAAGLRDSTVVVYTSDQGFFLGDHGWYDKRFMYEEALRSPLLVRYPPEVAPGSVCDAIVLNVDYAQTFLDFAGVPGSALTDRAQGASLRPLLRGQPPPDWRTAMYYHYYESGEPHTVPRHYGIRTDRFKLIRFYDLPGDEAQWEFYDLASDPHEVRNLYNVDPTSPHAETIAGLKARLRELRRQLGDTEPPEAP